MILMQLAFIFRCCVSCSLIKRLYFFRQFELQSNHKEEASLPELHGYALAVLVAHIKDMYDANSGPSLVFKLTDLAKFYSDTLKGMGVDHSPHTTRLKDRLLAACPLLQATGSAGQDILFTFRKDYDEFVRSSPRDYQMNAF